MQAAHVSIISLSSCIGRITAGTSSDILLRRFGLQRTWCLVCASLVAILAQLSGWLVTTIDHLVNFQITIDANVSISCPALWASGMACSLDVRLSLVMFPGAPVLTILLASELFGMEYISRTSCESDFRAFSQNWGWITLTPAISGTTFNFSFGKAFPVRRSLPSGRIFDAHADGLFNRCRQGQTCYASAFLLTLVCATVALGFSLHLHLRRSRTQADILYID